MQITQNEATAAERRIPFLAVRAQANSVVDLDFNDIGSGDSFTLTWDGQITGSVSYSADFSAALQTAIEALSNFAAGDVEVVLLSGVIYRIYVGGQWVGATIPLPTVTETGFTMGDITGGVSDSSVTDIVFETTDLEVSKAGGAFAESTGTATEVDHGIYYYEAAAGEVDTLGSLVVVNLKLGLSVYPPSAQIVEAASGATVLHSGLAQSGASGSITLASGASGTSDFYVPCLVKIVAGTGAGQGGRIGNAYNGTTKVLDVTPAWITVPDATSEYELEPIGAVPIDDIVDSVRSETDAALEDYDAPTNTEFEARSLATADYATAAGITDIQSRIPAALVSGRMSSDAVAVGGSTTAASKLVSHAAGVLQVVVGAGSSGTSIVLNATTGINGGAPSATNDVYNGRILVMTSGACAGQAKAITDYVGSTVTLTTESFTTSPSAADTGVIV